MRRRLALAVMLPTVAAAGVMELLRDGYAAPVMFGCQQWIRGTLCLRRREAVNELDPFV
jgi:hypothetical protein